MKKNWRVFEYDVESGEQEDSDIINMYVIRNKTKEEMTKYMEDEYGVGSLDVKFEEING